MTAALRPLLFLIWSLLFHATGLGQTLGGRAAYNFLKLPASPLATASGGINISYRTNEAGLSAGNPALLYGELHKQLQASFTHFFGGIKGYGVTGALEAEKLQTTFGCHLYFIDYGTLPNTDAAGNVSGEFRPADFVVQASAARKYGERWTYGGTVKFINSSYQQYASTAVAVDVGVLYVDSANNFSASVVARNMGTQLKTYAGEKEDLPFDLQAGITKRLAKAPFGFSLTAYNLHRFHITYNDTTFNRNNNVTNRSGILNNLFGHLVLATHVYLGRNLEATVGYNALRRQELTAGVEGGGLTGFSAGLRLRLPRLQVLYAHSAYQRGMGYHQLAVAVHLDRLFGLGE